MSTGLYSGVSGLALGVGLYKGVSGLWSGASGLITGFGGAGGGAALALDFLAGSPLPSTVTFSRTSNATLVDSTGKLTYAPNNLVINSEAFNDATWARFGTTTVVANAVAAPNGTLTADAITLPAASGIYRNVASTVGTGYITSIWLRSDTPQTVRLLSNTDTGVIVSTTCSVTTSWQRFYVYRVAPTGSTVVNLQLDTGGGGTFYAWGAQIEAVTYQTTPSTYNSTSPANLLGYTEEFDNGAWFKASVTVTANATTAPDGSLSADKLVEAAATAYHYVSSSITAVSGSTYTLSVYAKAAENGFVNLQSGGAAFTSSAGVSVNLSTGAQLGYNGATTYGAVDVGNGWWRIYLTLPAVASGTGSLLVLTTKTLSGNPTYAGDGTSGNYIWGAQLANSGSVDPYVYNPGAALTTTAYYGPRFDYDPTNLTAKGLLIEGQRTNLLLYSQEFDNAAWAKTDATVTVNAATSPDGTSSADKLVATAVSTNGHQVGQTVNFVAGTAYSMTCYMRAGEYAFGNLLLPSAAFTSNQVGTFDLTNGLASVSVGTPTVSISNAGNGWWRVSVVATATTTAIGYAVIRVNSTYSNNVYTGDGTSGIYIWGAQVEAGAFATSYIPTATAQVTRSADVVQILGTNFSSWYNQSEGTFVLGGDVLSSVATRVWMDVGPNGAFGTTAYIGQTPSDIGLLPGAAPVNMASTVSTTALSNTLAIGLQTNNSILAVNGVLGPTDTSCTMPAAATQLTIGSPVWSLGGSPTLNGHIRSISYYPARLPNTTLQALTS